MADIVYRPVTEEEYPAFVKAFIEGFSDDVPGEGFVDSIKATLPPERTLAAFDGDEIVGTFAGFGLDVTVPGGHLPMEGTTVVTVFPTHRRKGVMNEMMRLHLDAAVSNGYAIAGLWASESSLYGRYGYGAATFLNTVTMVGSRIRFRDGIEIDRVRRVDVTEALNVISPIFDDVCARTPGVYARDDIWWQEAPLNDADWTKHGKTSRRVVVHDGPDGPDGYVIYRQKSGEADDGHANGTVHISELVATSDRAHTALWHYVTHVDGCPNVRYFNSPIDDPLAMKLVAPRRVKIAATFDALWIVLLDVVVALEARTYERDGSLRFSVSSPFRPDAAGTYEMVVNNARASVHRTTGRVDIEDIVIDIDVLGALYLGGGDAHAYASASRVRGDATSVALLHNLFRTARAPWCNEVF